MFERYDAYKDSGVEWLRDVPKHWEIVRIKSLSLVRRGASPRPIDAPKYFSENGEYAWVRIADVTASNHYLTETKEKLSKLGNSYSVKILPGQLFLSIAGSVGKPIISRIKCCIHDGFVYFPFLKIDNEFLYRVFECGTPFIGLGKHGTQLNLNTETVGNIKIALPPQNEQLAIVNFLDRKTLEIDQLIEIKEQQIALLNERKQIVIQKAVTQGLDSNVPMKDSGVEWISQIPEHWECKPSRYAFRAVKRFKRDGTEIKFSVTQKWGVIPTDEMQESATQAVSFDGFQICLEDDLVLNKYKAHLGVFWRAPSRGLITGNYTVFEPLKGINSKYFELLYHTPVYIDIFRTIVYGVIEGMMPLYNNDFYDMLSIVPPLEEQLAIVQYVGEQQKEFSKIERVFLGQIEKLKEYKTTLINDAVTGKIKVA